MQNIRNSLNAFKQSLDHQGFVSPMLSKLAPNEKLRRSSSHQEIFGYVLDGELKVLADEEHQIYTKHEIFFIDNIDNFEIHSGDHGVEYLFAFKHKS